MDAQDTLMQCTSSMGAQDTLMWPTSVHGSAYFFHGQLVSVITAQYSSSMGVTAHTAPFKDTSALYNLLTAQQTLWIQPHSVLLIMEYTAAYFFHGYYCNTLLPLVALMRVQVGQLPRTDETIALIRFPTNFMSFEGLIHF